MTETEMNVALAEFEGLYKPWVGEPPNYGSSLDACHRVEVKLNNAQRLTYATKLHIVVFNEGYYNGDDYQDARFAFMLANATAPQRRKTLCMTLWPERWAERREA